MVVALGLEGDAQAVSDVDHAGVLAWTLEDGRAVGWKALQEERRVLVAAMLGPEEREDRELEVVRRPAEQLADTVELPVRQAERAVQRLFCDRGQREVTSLPFEEDRAASRAQRNDPRRIPVERDPRRHASGRRNELRGMPGRPCGLPVGARYRRQDVVVAPLAGRHERPHHALLLESQAVERASRGEILNRGSCLDPFRSALAEEVVDEQGERLATVPLPAVAGIEDLDPELDDPRRERTFRPTRADVADEPPVGLDREVEPAGDPAARAGEPALELRAVRPRRHDGTVGDPSREDDVKLVRDVRAKDDACSFESHQGSSLAAMEARGGAEGWRRVGILRPLAIRDFRLLWSGLSVSLLGDGIFLVALPWLVLSISDSATSLALVGVAWTVPMVAFLLVGGVISDRFDRRRVMIVSDIARFVATLGLGLLATSGRIELWHVFALAVVYGAGDALFYPAFGAVVPELVPTELLVQANSLDGFVRPLGSQLIGPAVGGLAIEGLGVGGAFLLDAGSFVCSAAAIFLMRPRPRDRAAFSPGNVVGEIREGLRFVRSKTWLWGTLVAAAVSLLVFLGPWEVLLPFLVKNELDRSAGDLGLVYAAGGAGAVTAALIMGQRQLPSRMVTFMYVGWTIGVSGLVVYGVATALWQLVATAAVAAGCNAAALVVWSTLMQRNVPGELLGRVTSLDWMISISLLPISFALTGPIAAAIGVRATLVGAGVLGAAIFFAFLFLPGMRDLERDGRDGAS